VDDPGHYNYLEFNTAPPPTTGAVERSADNYQGLDRGRAPPPPPAPHHYAGIAASASRPPTSSDAHDYLQPVEPVRNDERRSGLELPWQPYGSRDRGAAGRQQRRRRESLDGADRQAYEGLDPSAVEELRRPQRPHSYAGIGTAGPRTTHSYLEIIGYAGTADDDRDDRGVAAAEDCQGRDPSEVGESSGGGVNKPGDCAGLVGSGGGNGGGEATERGNYQGLDPAELEESRRRAARPRVYAGLKVDVEDLYSRPVKR